MANYNNRSHLILKLAKEAIELPDNDSNNSDEWKVVEFGDAAKMDTQEIILDKNEDKQGIENSLTKDTELDQDNYYSVLESLTAAIPSTSEGKLQEVSLDAGLSYNGVVTTNMEETNSEQQLESEHSLSDPYSSDDSNADPNYVSESSSSTEEGNEPDVVAEVIPPKKRKVEHASERNGAEKKRLSNPKQWIKNRAKHLRNSGEAYTSSSSRKKAIPARKVLQPCKDVCKLKCYTKFTNEERQQIFDDYWGLADLEKQRRFLSASMTTITPKYRYVREDSRRRPNNAFFFEIHEQKIRVCKVFFKSTLCITDRPLRTVLKKRNLFTGQMLSSDLRGKHGHHLKVDEVIKNNIRNHIIQIPRIESHYCRSHTSKQYIEGGKTLAQLHRDYKQQCDEQNTPAGNYQIYAKIFNEEFNLSFYVPKKDQCEVCLGYNTAVGDEKAQLQIHYEIHRLETDLSRKEKENDKKSSNIVAVYDLQAVMPCPSGEASSFYYVSKLNVFNLTVCNIRTKDVQCYVWHEAEAQRGVNEIGTCILRYLETILQDERNKENDSRKKNVIFFSDNCGGQQENRFMIAMYMYAVLHYDDLESITHKFLIAGHTQNEGDSAHSVIERNVKRSKRSGPVFLPDQYVTLIRSAKKSGQPYKVDELCHKDIFDLKQLATDFGLNSFPKNTNGDPVKISEIRVIKVMKDSPGKLFYKNSYQQEEFHTVLVLNQRKKFKKPKLNRAYNHRMGITEKKKIGLLSLFKNAHKKPIPFNYLPFYKSL